MGAEFHEVVIEGPRGRALGFIEGFVVARSSSAGLIDAEAEGFDVATMRERVEDSLFRRSETSHLLVRDGLLGVVEEAIEAARSRGVDLRTVRTRHVSCASFDFSFNVYSTEFAEPIKRFFENLPKGAKLTSESTIEEIRDPAAAGLEAYAPAHDYELRGRGRVHGAVEAVLEAHRFCLDDDLVQQSSIRLHEA